MGNFKNNIFRNKNIVIMGLGLYGEGSGISATKFLVAQGAKVLVTDLKTKDQLKDQIARLGPLTKKIKFVLGEHREIDFRNADLIIRNPAVPRSSKYLQIARARQIPVETDISLFFQLVAKKRLIGITGTRGKSTTTSLIYEIIKAVDKNAVLGGNITKSPLAQMNQVKKGGLVVLELSSWLIEELPGANISPHIAVVTNIYPDHLNTYKNMADYAAAKENIWQFQNCQDYVILNRDNKFTREMGRRVPAQRFWFSLKEFKEENGCLVAGGKIVFRRDGRETEILKIADLQIIGEHNLANVLAAVSVGMIFGVKPSAIKTVVRNFKGLADRLEFLREARGVKYYNDTTATTPEATMAALVALGKEHKKKIILIFGGADKGLNFNQVLKEIKKSVKALVLLDGTGTQKILNQVKKIKLPLAVADSMADAVGLAQSFSQKGDLILLSPGFTSFGMFVNEFDRGNQFKNIVGKLK